MSIDYLERPALVLGTDLKTGEHTRLLEGLVAIVTGGGKGVGKGISIRLAEAGAKVVIVGNANMTMAEETCLFIRSRGGEAVPLGCDLAKPESAQKVVDFTLEKFGRLDILVNNAAYQPNRDIVEYSTELYKKVMDINLMSFLRLSMCAMPHLKESDRGRIINISSVHGKKVASFDIAYATSKGGVTMLTRELAVIGPQYGITCNAILPGGIEIEFKTSMEKGDLKEFKSIRVERSRKFKFRYKMGFPSDVGNMVVFLASEQGKHYNGTQIRADGGMILF
ncbi:MAG: SDR family oxidoreductase [Clostridia bacterium]|nr:SDR family oxidoreductase [Clostridia bacterium]